MKSALRLIQLCFFLSLLAGCTASPAPTAVVVASPSPVPQTEVVAPILPTLEQDRSLAAGQWNTLFYHPQLKKVVLVNGGPDRGKPASDPLELWAWDGSEWTLLSSDPQGPRWRNFAAAAFDSKRNRLVIYGGLQSAAGRMEEIWEWDGKTWTQFTGTGPGFREGAMMAYDEARGRAVLFGGANERFEMLGDTWEWDGSQWTQAATSGPPARFPSAIAYDAARKKVLLFSGHSVSGNDYINFSDFWEWDGSSWTEIIVDGEKPGARNISQMVFLPSSGDVVLFSGGEDEFLSDMWVWDGMRWTQIAESGAPARSGLGGAYDMARNRMVVFGGVDKPGGKAITDTWEWDGQHWKCVQGCSAP